jgi:hypothetical protein
MLRFTMIAILDVRHDVTWPEIRVECLFMDDLTARILRRCVGGPV